MRALIRAVVALAVLFSTLLTAIIGLSYRDPSQNRWAYLFTNADGSRCASPCLLGVDLTKQTFQEADLLLSKHPALVGAKRQSGVNSSIVYTTSQLQAYLQQRQVGNSESGYSAYMLLEVKFISDVPKLGDIILSTEIPIGYRSGGDGAWCRLIELYMKTGEYTLSTNENDTCLRINQKIEFIAISSPESENIYFYTWSGFNQNRDLNAVQHK